MDMSSYNQLVKSFVSHLLLYFYRFKCRRCVNSIQVKAPGPDTDCNSDMSQWHHSTDRKGLQDIALKGAWAAGTPVTFVFHHHSHELQRLTV